ncbi:MAG TPA: ABC transporter permease [Opitutaceae bacterium]|nr:ABC transporter permease [Opitutaceae bacterium]
MARKRDLWWQFTVRAVEMRHRGSFLGPIWALLNPLLMLAVYAVVFGVIFQSRYNVLPHETSVDYVLALYLGLILFQLIAETMAVAPMVVIGSPNLVKKVVFPLDVLPLSQLGASWFHFLMSFMLLLLGAAFIGRGLSIEGVLWMPVILAPLALLSIGLGWILSALGVFYRDIAQAVPFASQIVLYASAVFYPRERITPAFWAVLKWNPFLHTVMLSRNALLWSRPVSLGGLAYTYAVGLAAFFLGRWVFRRLQPAFADVI